MAKILVKRGTAAPAAAALTQYELAVDTTNKRIYIGNSGGSGDLIGSAPGGSTAQIQFNSSGNFAGDVDLTFDGTNLQIGSQGDLRLADSDSSNYVGLQAPTSLTNNNIYTLPSAVGSANQVLQIASVVGNDATLQWATASGGSSSPGGSDTYVQFNDGSTFGGDAGLTYNKTTDTLSVDNILAIGNQINIANAASGRVAFGDFNGAGNSTFVFIRDGTTSLLISNPYGDIQLGDPNNVDTANYITYNAAAAYLDGGGSTLTNWGAASFSGNVSAPNIGGLEQTFLFMGA